MNPRAEIVAPECMPLNQNALAEFRRDEGVKTLRVGVQLLLNHIKSVPPETTVEESPFTVPSARRNGDWGERD